MTVDRSGQVFRDRDRVRSVIQNGEPQTVTIENNIVVNNVITVDDIEKRTSTKVVVLEEKAVDNPDAAGKADSTSVAIFNPEVKEETSAKPKKTRKFEEVVKEREAKGLPEQEQPSGQAATTTEEPVTETKKDKATGAVVPQGQNADQPAAEEKKKDTASTDQQNVDETVNVPAEEQTAPVDKKKKKKDAAAAPEQQAVEKSVEAPAEEQAAPAENKKTDVEQPANTDLTGKPECDPAVADCPPTQ